MTTIRLLVLSCSSSSSLRIGAECHYTDRRQYELQLAQIVGRRCSIHYLTAEMATCTSTFIVSRLRPANQEISFPQPVRINAGSSRRWRKYSFQPRRTWCSSKKRDASNSRQDTLVPGIWFVESSDRCNTTCAYRSVIL